MAKKGHKNRPAPNKQEELKNAFNELKEGTFIRQRAK